MEKDKVSISSKIAINDLSSQTKEQLIEQVEALRAEVQALKQSSEEPARKAEKLARVILDEMY